MYCVGELSNNLLSDMHVPVYNARHINCDFTITATRKVKPIF